MINYILILSTVFPLIFITTPSYAITFTLSGEITINGFTGFVRDIDTTDSSGNYSLKLLEASYDIKIVTDEDEFASIEPVFLSDDISKNITLVN